MFPEILSPGFIACCVSRIQAMRKTVRNESQLSRNITVEYHRSAQKMKLHCLDFWHKISDRRNVWNTSKPWNRKPEPKKNILSPLWSYSQSPTSLVKTNILQHRQKTTFLKILYNLQDCSRRLYNIWGSYILILDCICLLVISCAIVFFSPFFF